MVIKMLIGTVPLPKEEIDVVFEQADERYGYIFPLYALVIPDWDRVEKVGWVKVSLHTNKYIMRKAADHDKANGINPHKTKPGGVWFDSGFGTDFSDEAEDWVVDFDGVEIKYKDNRGESYSE